MPIYEYECPKCRKIKEIVMNINDIPPHELKCEHCKKSNMNRVLSRTSFKLNGKGWIHNGYSK